MSERAAAFCLVSAAAIACAAQPGGAPRETPVDAAAPPDPRAALCPDAGAAAFVAFTQVQQIFDQNCLGCHGATGELPNLSDGASWKSLVSQPAPAPETCGGLLVSPGSTAMSYLYQKLVSRTPCSGEQMPRGELFSDPLPACVTAMVAQWIDEGAPDGGP